MSPASIGTDVKKRLILALDVKTLEEALLLVRELRDSTGLFKVGLELFTSCGPSLFEALVAEGAQLFFDSKFHDIPNTVAGASYAAVRPGVAMFNVHGTGGAEMMKAAAKASKEAAYACQLEPPKVLAVTILTSIDETALHIELGIKDNLAGTVVRLALMAKDCGLDGVVASAREVPAIREACGPDFLIVTPGVRPNWSNAQDQKRIVTPQQAIKNGSDYIVVGRPITGADNRREAAQRILEEMRQC